MKTKSIFLTVTVIASLTPLAMLAADNSSKMRETDKVNQRRDTSYSEPGERLGNIVKATDIIGMKIRNNQDEKLGKVEELAVDIENGRVVEVIVATGGILNVGEKYHSVPPRSLTRNDTEKALDLDMSAEKFKAGPVFETSRWDGVSDANLVTEDYRYYGEEPYFGKNNARNTDAKSPGRVEKASKLIGLAVRNSADEKIGVVENLLVSMSSGRIVHVVISTGGFLGMGGELSMVPPSALRYDETSKVLRLDSSREALMQAPHFKSAEWPNVSDPAYAANVYRAYNVSPYFNSNSIAQADNTGRNSRDRQENTLTPLDQGTSSSDVETTRAIRKEIMAREDLSVNAKNIKIITVNGRVTLRGPVNNPEEKRTIGDIASQIVSSARVDNQLEVKQEVSTN